MTTLTTRATKGSTLTYNELDANFSRNAQAKSGTYTVAETDNNDTIECSGTFTISLPDAATIVAASDTGDFETTIKNAGSGVITVGRITGADTIDGTAANFILQPTQACTFKVNQAGNGYNIISSHDSLTKLYDSNGNEVVILEGVASAVNEVTVVNAATTANPRIQSSGEANTGLIIADSNDNEVIIAESVASAVNEVTITNAAAGNKPSINQTGSGDVGLDIEGIEIKNGVIPTATITALTSSTVNSRESTPRRVLIDSIEDFVGTSVFDFTTNINSTYKRYEFELINLIPATDGDGFYCQVYIAGIISANYLDNTTSGQTYLTLAPSAVSNVAGEAGMSGIISLYYPSNTNRYKRIVYDMSYHSTAATTLATRNGHGQYYGATTAVTGLRIGCISGGNFVGTVNVYGVT